MDREMASIYFRAILRRKWHNKWRYAILCALTSIPCALQCPPRLRDRIG